MGILIRTATVEDEDAIFQFLRENYYPDEPLNFSAGRKVITNKSDCPYLEYLPKGLSILAVDEEQPQTILGVFLNKEVKKGAGYSAIDDLIEKHRNTIYEKIMKFIKFVNNQFDKTLSQIFEQNQTNMAFDVTVITVGKNCRRQNLAGSLMDRAISLAKSRQNGFMSIHCSSAYSVMLAKRHGFQIVYELPYKNYTDENGEVVFKPPMPHENFTILIKTLN